MSKQLKLSVYDNFRCLAESCPDTCCGGWDIEIDEATQQKWQQIEDKNQRDYLFNNIESQVRNEQERKIFKYNDDHKCMHLADNKLCGLHSRYGHDYLPKACRDFPRQFPSTNLKSLMTLSMACPEVVRMVLFGAQSSDNQLYDGTGSVAAITGQDLICESLDAWVCRVMRYERYTIPAKLTYIAQQLGRMSALNARGELNGTSLNQLIKTANNDLYQLNLSIKNNKLKIKSFTAGSYWLSIFQILANSTQLDISDSPLLSGLQQLVQEQDKFHRYERAYELISKTRNEHADLQTGFNQALHRYAEASLMNKGFPWQPFVQNYIATYLNCVIPFTAVQMMLWAAAERKQSLSQDDVIKSIYMVERVIGHSQVVYKNLSKYPELLHIEVYYSCFQDVF